MDKLNECDLKIENTPVNSLELNLPEGIPPLRAFYLYLSDSCNLRCRHCWITPTFINGKLTPGAVINVRHLKKAVREGKTLGLSNAKLTGGEPLLHPEFRDIASILTEENLNLDLETNGTLIDREKAEFMKKQTNINFISISLDSAAESYHDAFRGKKGAYRAALSGLENLVVAGYRNVQIIMSVHKNNVGEVQELVALAEANGADSVKLTPITNNGRGALMHENDETLNITEVLALADLVRGDLKRIAKIPVILNIPPSVRPLSELTESGRLCGDCGVDHILGILGSGDIALCGIGRNLPEFVYGNIATDSIRDIWFNHPQVAKLRHDLSDFDHYPELCRNCIYMRRCRTGCVVQNYSNNGKLIWPQDVCLHAEKNMLFKDSRKRLRH